MNSTFSKPKFKDSQTLRGIVFSLLDAKIQYIDFKLSKDTRAFLKDDQEPGQAPQDSTIDISSQDNYFSIIENSGLYTTKLLFLRSSLTDWNCKKILYLLNHKDIEKMSLEEIKSFLI